MDLSLAVIAGTISTVFFLAGELPMLAKAARTRELGSYSFGNIVIANGGNVVHSVYVYSLPPGPIWMLHSFYLVTTALMLFWYLRYEGWPRHSARKSVSDQTPSRNEAEYPTSIPHSGAATSTPAP